MLIFTWEDHWGDGTFQMHVNATERKEGVLANYLYDCDVSSQSFSGFVEMKQKTKELRTTGKLQEAYDFSSNSWGVDVMGNEVIIYFLYDEDNEEFKQRYSLEEFERAISDCIEFLRKHMN